MTKGKITLFWDSYNDSFGDAVSLRRVAHLATATGKWENEGTNAGTGTTATGTVQSNTVSNWSPFTLGTVPAVALPIRLVEFSGKKVDGINILNWQTNLEINASHFEIERSIDAKAFEKIGKVSANYLTKENSKYEFIDTQLPIVESKKPIYYRLKMVDTESKYDYSKTISISDDAENEIVGKFYPNPTIENFANIDIVTEVKGEWKISMIDGLGKLINSEKVILEKGINKIQISDLRFGLNLVKFENEKLVEIRKLIK